jgi:hypothetical protein
MFILLLPRVSQMRVSLTENFFHTLRISLTTLSQPVFQVVPAINNRASLFERGKLRLRDHGNWGEGPLPIVFVTIS